MGTSFQVLGIPASQGSKRLLANRAVVESSARVKPWRADVREAAIEAGVELTRAPVRLALRFRFPRPKSHLTTTGGLRKGAPAIPGRPDVDKLARAVLDALTGVVYVDDGQVAELLASKVYEDPPGLRVFVEGAEPWPT